MDNISVCLPTYNGERFVEEQLESILGQLSREDEIVVSDDCSEDLTLSIVRQIKDKRIKLYSNIKRFGVIKNTEKALRYTNNKIIVLSDQDDVWLRNKTAIIKDLFDQYRDEKYLTLLMNGNIIGKNNQKIGEDIFSMLKAKKGVLRNIYRNSYMGCCMAFNRKLLELVLDFPDSIPMHDSWIGILSEIFGRVVFVNEKTISYRIHGENFSLKKNQLNQQISWRLSLVYQIFLRTVAIKLFKKRFFSA